MWDKQATGRYTKISLRSSLSRTNRNSQNSPLRRFCETTSSKRRSSSPARKWRCRNCRSSARPPGWSIDGPSSTPTSWTSSWRRLTPITTSWLRRTGKSRAARFSIFDSLAEEARDGERGPAENRRSARLKGRVWRRMRRWRGCRGPKRKRRRASRKRRRLFKRRQQSPKQLSQKDKRRPVEVVGTCLEKSKDSRKNTSLKPLQPLASIAEVYKKLKADEGVRYKTIKTWYFYRFILVIAISF